MKFIATTLAATAMLAAPAFAGDCGSKNKTASYEANAYSTPAARYVSDDKTSANIVETAQAAGSFNTLLAAADAAGLVGALSGDGPLTVFAPTDAAFAALPEGTVETLLKPENKDQLAAVLKLHVIAGAAVTSDQLAGTTTTAETLNGPVAIDGTDGVTVNDANVVTADIAASNGVIHVIDKVLLPAS